MFSFIANTQINSGNARHSLGQFLTLFWLVKVAIYEIKRGLSDFFWSHGTDFYVLGAFTDDNWYW